MTNHHESTLHFPRSSELRATTRFALRDALARCWKLVERLFTRNDAPYY